MHAPSMKTRNNARTWKARRLLRRPRELRSRRQRRPRLRFSPTAWAKLLFVRDCGPTEVGGFGIASEDDLLYVEDIRMVKQACTAISVGFDDAAVAEFFDEQIDACRRPEQFGRIWIHTHPGDSAAPSRVDEETFRRVFGPCDWALMFILAQGGETYCRLRFNTGPGGAFEIPVEIDFETGFGGTNFEAWAGEYEGAVQRADLAGRRPAPIGDDEPSGVAQAGDPIDEFFRLFDMKKESDFYERTP
jgi:proteasome lid subunit RPN8/RPN11